MRKSVLAGLTILGAAALLAPIAGCNRNSAPKLEDKTFIGTWLEVGEDRSLANNPRVPKVSRKSQNMRQITFAPDHTFKLLLVKSDGQPENAAKLVEGNWQLENDGSVAFKVGKKTVDKKLEDWMTPETVSGPDKNAGELRCYITHQDSGTATYKKTN